MTVTVRSAETDIGGIELARHPFERGDVGPVAASAVVGGSSTVELGADVAR